MNSPVRSILYSPHRILSAIRWQPSRTIGRMNYPPVGIGAIGRQCQVTTIFCTVSLVSRAQQVACATSGDKLWLRHGERTPMTGRSTRTPTTAIPEQEIELFKRQVRSKIEYDDPQWIIDAYRKCGLTVLPGAFNAQVAALIVAALREGTPLSVIRIGDGEANIVAYRNDMGTPNLDRHALAETLSTMEDSFDVSELWMTILRDLCLLAIGQADIVGVRGFSSTRDPLAVRPRKDAILRRLSHDLRGAVGGWRSIDLMLRFAELGFLFDKTIASAHLYFSVLKNLDEIISNATTIICITSRGDVAAALRRKYPHSEITHIAVGRGSGAGQGEASILPEFLLDVEDRLPGNMQGCLCLVGAGVWSEIYCTWIRRKGGVGVDIGSGFDLLAGKVTRPFHRAALESTANSFALV